MRQHQWQLMAMTLVLAGVGHPNTAQAQAGFTGPPPLPRSLPAFMTPGVGRYISTVDNFDGIVGVALMQGTGKDNKGNTLEFELDVRAMQGVYLDRNGTSQRGTFSFTWLDLYTGSGPTRHQIHDISFLSLPAPLLKDTDANFGPFWTGHIPEASVTGNPYTTKMTLDFADAPQQETFVVFGPTSVPAKATVHLEWSPGYQSIYPYFDPAPTYSVRDTVAGFMGTYTLAGAHMDFSFTSETGASDKTPFTFTSDPDGQRVLFAQVGHEVHGIYVR